MASRMTVRLPAVLALAVVGLGSLPAAAQTTNGQSTTGSNREGVREILGRAETAGARRTLGGILGGLSGISQAQAQTAPASPPPAAAADPAAPATAATPTPPPFQPVPAATGPVFAPGSPEDPTMIVRIPANGPSAPVTAQQPASAAPPIATVTQDAGAPVPRPASAAIASDPSTSASALPPARAPRVLTRRISSHNAAWCAPSRW
jgi:hypothetical protein